VTGTLEVRNRQHERRINNRVLKEIVGGFLVQFSQAGASTWDTYELAIHLVDHPEIRNLNETWLRHHGATDVITFDYSDPAQPRNLSGEIFVCVRVAVSQAKQFEQTWQSEVVRYVVHGILHLAGFDDRTAKKSTEMKRAENHWMKALSLEYDFREIASAARRTRQAN
jgi:rRNA maturation RNase YbeY